MNWIQISLFIGALLVAVLVYFLLKKTSLSGSRKKWFRALLFFFMIGYLSFDFYTKQKYGLILVLFLGSIAFVYMLRKSKD